MGEEMLRQTLFFALGAYLAGAIPFGKIIARFAAHIDITQRGSKNIGATNVARELGMKWGLLTLMFDVLKGMIPVLLFIIIASQDSPWFPFAVALISLCPLVGHQFSIFMGFRGGKGVATALGIYLVFSTPACLMGLLVFILLMIKWRYVSLGSMVSAFTMPIFLTLLNEPVGIVLTSVMMAALIFYRHGDNVMRLVGGTENKWKQ